MTGRLEFIDNYQYTIHEPLNDYEKLLIALAVEQYEFIYENWLKTNKLK
jgi:hypothetical protein